MPLYFFHLISPEERCPDDSGCELPNVESAYLEVYRAALDISFEMLRHRRDPAALRFEVTNEGGDVLFDLPFSEALRPARRASTMTGVHANLQRAHDRSGLRPPSRASNFAGPATITATRALLARRMPR